MLSLNDIVMGIFSDLVAIYVSSVWCMFRSSVFIGVFISSCWILSVCSVLFDSLQPNGLQPDRLRCPWDFSGKNTSCEWQECVAIYHFLFLLEHAFAVISKKITKSRSFKFSPRFYSKCFIFWLLHLYLWYLWYLCKVCFYVVFYFLNFLLFFLYSLTKIRGLYVYECFWVFYSIPLIYVYILSAILCCHDYCSSLTSLESKY